MSVSPVSGQDWTRVWFGVFLVALAVGAALRLTGLGVEGLSHPEIYIPGIPLPDGISEPPPRLTFRDALWWHFHDEPHPVAYYLAMMGWTDLFGTSETALRLPGAILGALSIAAIYAVGARVWGPAAGAVAAMMLALHGFHLFWSQNARMYVPAALMAILAQWFLIALTTAPPGRRRWYEAGYVLSLTAGLHLTELFWALLGMHLVWPAIAAQRHRAAPGAPLDLRRLVQGFRLSQLHGLVVALGAPELAHTLYRARHGAASAPSATFLGEVLGFGFLFPEDEFSLPLRSVPPAVLVLLAVATLLLCALAFRAPVREAPTLEERALPSWLRFGVAVAMSALVLWLASIAHNRNGPMAVIALFPLLALATPAVVLILARLLSPIGVLRRVEPAMALIFLTGLAAPLAIFVAAFAVSVLAPRAFIIFTPSLLLMAAAGVTVLFPGRWLALGAAAVALVFAASVPYNLAGPISPRDYKALAAAMRAEMEPGDLVFVRSRNWEDTPLFYYLPGARLVAADWASAVAGPAERVWLVRWIYPNIKKRPVSDDRSKALEGWVRAAEVDALRGRAELFVRAP